MTTSVMELSYDLSARELERNWRRLIDLSAERKGGPLTRFNSPFWQFVIVLILGYMVIPSLVDFVQALVAGEGKLMQTYGIFDLLIGFVMIWVIVDGLRGLLGGALRWLRAEKFWREGMHWGEHHLTVTPEALWVRKAETDAVYRWPAFTAFHKTKDMLLLTITPGSAVAVPRRAFQSPAEETAFCDFVEARVATPT